MWLNDTFKKYQVHKTKLCANKSLSASLECFLFILAPSLCPHAQVHLMAINCSFVSISGTWE